VVMCDRRHARASCSYVIASVDAGRAAAGRAGGELRPGHGV